MSQPFSAPRKSLGQNFLQDPNTVRRIVDSLNVKPHEVVMEVGPGRGALTDLILPLTAQLHLVEFDRDLARHWQARAATLNNLILHEKDILKFDLSEVLSSLKIGHKLKVIGNLPYNISSPVLFHLMFYADMIESQVLMLQKEVVERMCASPGNKQYGRLSVMLQYRYTIENLFTVPATAFFPPPKVESAVARLTPLPHTDCVVTQLDDFELVVKQAFAQRRKTLRNTLRNTLTAAQLEQAEVDPRARAETLTVASFVRLANLYTAAK